MHKLKTIVYQFYRPAFVFNTVLSIYLIYRRDLLSFPQTLPIKLFGYSIIIGFQYYTASKIYYYYRNAGYSIRKLYVYSCILDLIIYSILSLIPTIIHGLINT